MELIRLFVGYDTREAVAFDVFQASVIKHASRPVSFTPLSLKCLDGIYTEAHHDGSNQFIYSRFLVPYLCGFKGWAIFADGDMLVREDIAKLWALRDPDKAVQVVKHDYCTKAPVKYLGAKNEDYPRKNWSSLILWNCGHPANQRLTPEWIETSSGRQLHRFEWLKDCQIGSLPQKWNWLVGEYDYNQDAKLVHYTLGTPCFRGYSKCDYSVQWYAQLFGMLYVPDASDGYASIVNGASMEVRDPGS